MSGILVPESTYTDVRDHCPNPELWNAPDPDSSEAEVTALVGAMVTALRPTVVVETGTFVGHTAWAIGQALDDAGFGHLYTIEIDPELADQARARCVGLPVTVITGDSLTYTPPGKVDFCWLDSAIDTRHREILRFLPHMHHRTVIGVHDTGPQHSVRGHLEPLIADGVIEPPLWLPTPRGAAFTRLKAVSTRG